VVFRDRHGREESLSNRILEARVTHKVVRPEPPIAFPHHSEDTISLRSVEEGPAPERYEVEAPATAEDFDPRSALLDWYDHHRRDLPWRRQPDPYRTLISEIMLQQTQVDRVIPYFERFVARFPDFKALAAAPRADVIQLWAGLGYNRRAAQLHELARLVVERHGGELPPDAEALRKLPGIGPYTVGAVLSIAFGQDEPALDTNVRRVVARYAFESDPTPRALQQAAHELVPPGRAGEWNQALMDLGATICVGQRPRCLLCPLRPECRSVGRAEGPLAMPPKRQGRFEGSSRYYRGRLLGELRDLPPGAAVPLDEMARRLAVQGVAEPPAGWQTVSEGLARDGLARLEERPEGVTVGLA
jgi:A/G-specific adenine glycosylase